MSPEPSTSERADVVAWLRDAALAARAVEERSIAAAFDIAAATIERGEHHGTAAPAAAAVVQPADPAQRAALKQNRKVNALLLVNVRVDAGQDVDYQTIVRELTASLTSRTFRAGNPTYPWHVHSAKEAIAP